MELDEAREFIRDRHRAVLATMRAGGEPQLSPVLVTVDAAGRVLVSSREAAYKVRNLRRDPRAWVCVLPDGFFGRWIQVRGRAEVISLPQAMAGLQDYYRRTAGEHPDWAEYRESMRTERRVLIRIELDAAGPDRQG